MQHRRPDHSSMAYEVFEWEGGLRVEVRREKRRGIRLQLTPEGILDVRAPPYVDIREILMKRRRWIERRLAAFEEAAWKDLDHQDMLLLRGKWYLMRAGSECRLPADGEEEVSYDTPHALAKYLRMQLREEIENLVTRHAARMHVRCKRIAIRNQRTRWGSCSSSGNLSFNLTLIALPSELCEYVVIHEVAHLREGDHSSRYWRLLESFCPDYRRMEERLKLYWLIIERNRVWQVIRSVAAAGRSPR